MLLRQLEYLTALGREGHFGRAAQTCHVSQPGLSAAIRKLEAELGVQIVRRGQRFEGFTAEGAVVLRWAQRVVAEQTIMRQELEQMRSGLVGTLRIGAIPTAMTVSTLLMTPMRENHSGVNFSLESLTSREIVRRLNEFDLDVGLTYVDGEPLGRVRTLPLYRERYLFLTPSDGPCGTQDSVTWSDAAAMPLCLLVPTMQNRRILDGIFAEAGVQARAVVETDTVSAIYSYVSSMHLSSVIPHAWTHRFGVPEGARVLPLPQPTRSFHVGLVLPGNGPEAPLTKEFVSIARGLDFAALLCPTTSADH